MLGAIGVAVVLAVLRFVGQHAYSLYDDAYIYLRYADNLARGCGLRFNCEDAPVEGFTSPLYLALLWLGGRTGVDLETVSQILGAGLLALALCQAVALAARLGAPWGPGAQVALAAAAGFVLAADHDVLLNAVIGLETPLTCVAVAWVAARALAPVADPEAAGQRRGLPAAVVLALFTRPECALFVVALPLLLPRGSALARARWLGPVVVGVVALVLARWLIFHDVAPNTYWAKAGGSAAHVRLGLRYVGAVFVDHPLMLAAPLALLVPSWRRPVFYLLLGAGFWLAMLVRTGGDTFLYGRLAMPIIPTLVVLGLAGLTAAAAKLAETLATRGVTIAGWALAALPLLAAIGLGTRAAYRHALGPSHGFDNVQRWTAVGQWLRGHHPQVTLAVVPIGAIGYFSRAHVIDLVGLATREVARAGRGVPPEMLAPTWIGHERHNTEWVLAQCPQLIVMTKWGATPFTNLQTARAGFYAEWLLLQEIKSGRAPYELYDAEVAPGVHWLMFRRRADVACPAA